MSSKRVAGLFDTATEPSAKQKEMAEKVSGKYKALADELVRMMPESPELTVGLRALLDSRNSVLAAVKSADA